MFKLGRFQYLFPDMIFLGSFGKNITAPTLLLEFDLCYDQLMFIGHASAFHFIH